MTMNPLPPQAYTKETLAKAYQWLQHQPSSVRELAKSSDILVSLYLKAQRHGEEFLDRPSVQTFKNELRSLAGMMGELEDPEQKLRAAPPSTPPAPTMETPLPTPPVPSMHYQAPVATNHQPSAYSGAILELRQMLDGRTWAMVQEAKNSLNLGSDMEALRLLVSIGFRKSKSLLQET